MFRTELPLTPHAQLLPLSARVLTIGSCFSDSIGARLAADKVSTLVNPFGTVFNPLSACQLLRAAAGEDVDWQQHVVEARSRWQSYDLHATIGADSPVELLQNIQQLLRDTGVFLATADVVLLTLGSAWVYRLKETGELVNNCHKVPAEKFDKELLTPDEIINAIAETHAYLRRRNPKLRFVLTVSPVRHLKDTLPLNAVSKSVLRVACHYLSELLPEVSYFPAYELLLDDLRDYRFYAEDMLHPSKVAEDYIWERFARTYFNTDFGRFRKEWEAVQKALSHRPLHLGAPEHRQFLENTLERLERLSGQADLRMEILDVRRQLERLPQPKLRPEPEPDLEDDEERIDIGEYAAEVKATTAAVATRNIALAPEADAEEEEEEAGQDDVLTTTEAEAEEILDALAPAKKKRRSRGGAKRNKKKHAARLAAEEANPEASDAATLTIAAPASATAEQAADEAAVAPRPSVPTVTIIADADTPLQTALERRKRNSRRGKGRNKASEPVVEQETPATPQLPPESAPTISEPTQVSEDVQLAPIVKAFSEPALPAAPSEPVAGARPVRSGRSASEKRAAALRKPHRPASRIKALYATDTAAAETPATEAPVPTPPTAPPVEAPTAAEPTPISQLE
ncbi:MAG TPA: GSCFA domain-containing protein, partial [Hymenobacter sp.]|nr:GSCFA domain-containing protein [Hymenobacter sp.]